MGQIKENILNQEWLEELVRLVNKELYATNDIFGEKIEAINSELNDVRNRLYRLYDVLETDKLTLDDLAPRIKELRARQEELSKISLQLVAENIACGINQVDADTVNSYAEDLKNLLEEVDIAESKVFLRLFIKWIFINEKQVVVHYNLPLPDGNKMKGEKEVLPMVTPSGAGVTRTPYLLTASQV